ncbi:MAG TPA: ExeM/NucH family extracellular endonuclease [Intrasporangium sp.]|nr:ExeM/NucH family extracellular endonuclease [Intrasporangium sp.]
MQQRHFRCRVAAVCAVGLGVGLVPFVAAPTAQAAPTELFISEYIEGSSNNKALEFYNGTGAPVNLATGGYNVQMFFNGNPVSTLTINLTGTVATGDVYVLAQSSAAPAILAEADQTNGSGWFNGDDAVVLRKGTTVIDSLGQVGVDPGTEWGTGLTSTADNTLRRKASIEAGDTNPSDAFDPSATWNGFATDTFDGLGRHSLEEAPAVASSEPANGASGVAPDANVTVTFTEPVDVTGTAFELRCSLSGPKSVTVTGGPTTFVLDPDSDLAPNDSCRVTVRGDEVTDQDELDPPDTMTDDATVSFASSLSTSCDATYTPISTIQGSGSAADYTGPVVTEGVVVGDHEGPSPALRGFYLQDPVGDGDPATSDAIFVFNGNDDNVSNGDHVRVVGTAEEFQDQTQISSTTSITPCGTGTVQPTAISFPVENPTFLERYEGMLVSVPETMTVTEHFQLGRFGQVVVSSEGRLEQPTNVVEPGDEALVLQAANNNRRLIIDDSSQAQNPDPIVWGRNGEPLSASNTLRGGDTLTGAVGVLTYTWAGNAASGNAYRLRPIGALGGNAEFVAANERPSAAPAVGGTVQVASMNLLNYFNTFTGCRNGVGGASTDCRGAEDTTEFERQANKTVQAILGLGAEVIGVNEVENDGYGSTSALADLVGRLNAETAEDAWAYIDADTGTGQVNALGTDAIKVGMIYQRDAVTPVGMTAALNTQRFVNGGDNAPRTRPALAQAFRDNSTGGVFIATANHFKSKGSACTQPDQNDGQGNCNSVRTVAAEELAAWLATDPTGMGDGDVLILGDLNSYAKEDPIRTLEEAGYTNLVDEFIGPDAYSYVFDGQWGYLDHALGSASARQQVSGVAEWHINADEPSVLDYNTNFKSTGQVMSLYAPDQFRVSDHDPVIVGLSLDNDTPGFATGGGWYRSPAGALAGDPSYSGKALFELDAKYESGSVAPTGQFGLTLEGTTFGVASTSVDWLVLHDNEARLGGAATVNGVAGYSYQVIATDGGKNDTIRVVVRDSSMTVVYDSGEARVTGQVSIH